jgi:hypothetical protein
MVTTAVVAGVQRRVYLVDMMEVNVAVAMAAPAMTTTTTVDVED